MQKIHISKELNNEFVRNGNDYSINVKETNTIKDAFSLLHEYIHKLCTDLELTYVPDSYVCFSELVTRYGELLFTEFLASKKIDLWDLKLFNDGIKRSTFNNLCNFLIEYPMIEAAEDNDNFGRKFYDKNIKLFEKMNISYSSFMIICNNLINSGRVSSLDNYDYILGYLYALFLYQNTNDNMLEYLCNSLKDSRGIDEIIEKLALDEFSIEKINIGAGIYNY